MGGLLYNYEHLKISGLKMSEICQTEEGDGKRKSREKKNKQNCNHDLTFLVSLGDSLRLSELRDLLSFLDAPAFNTKTKM